jgi:multisubunit Na+/H+ antiporter MnhB subunit
MTAALTAFDLLLALSLVGFAAVLLNVPDLFEAIVLFIVFGLLMAVTWGRLGAVDVALAEAAIGAGITGALLLNARGDLEAFASGHIVAPPGDVPGERGRGRFRIGVALLVAPVAVIVVWAVATAPAEMVGLRDVALAAVPGSGAEHPVTAVLLDFRAYDTLLEVAVLLLAVIGVWSQRLVSPRLEMPPPGLLLAASVRTLVPISVLIGGYLLWRGTHAPGGAFQAGAVLAGAGVLVLLAERPLPARGRGWPLRLGLAIGVLVFVAVGVLAIAAGAPLLYYRGAQAEVAILAIELAATMTIALTLVALFAGSPPTPPQAAEAAEAATEDR